MAGVVGVQDPRYHLFGPTVSYANNMESHGMPNRVHISEETARALESCQPGLVRGGGGGREREGAAARGAARGVNGCGGGSEPCAGGVWSIVEASCIIISGVDSLGPPPRAAFPSPARRLPTLPVAHRLLPPSLL